MLKMLDTSEIVGALLLGGLGHVSVEKFTSPMDAFATVAGSADFIELLVTDRDMPGLDGLSLAGHVRGFSPRTKVLLVSARTDDLQAETLRRAGVQAVLPKPFSLEQFESAVRVLCDCAEQPPLPRAA